MAICRYEVDREEKIGVGFFSDVYKGTWRRHTVAIKILAPTTPKKLFVHEIGIWKTLRHQNVCELLGASSATGDPPWFFVSPYYKNGSLVTFLKGETGLGGGAGAGGGKGGGLSMKFKDEDGGKVSLRDDSDFELAIETAREVASQST